MTRDDRKIRSDIIRRIHRDARISGALVDVDVVGGVAVLTGTVSTYKKKLALQLKAKQTRGVVSVDNRIEVVYANEFGNPPQTAILETAKHLLAIDADLDESAILVDINDGVATLKGSVKWFWQLRRVEELIGNIIGVIDLKNELTVVPSESIHDEIIASDIMDELKSLDHIEPDRILVEVENGAVTLSGSVDTYADENAVYEAAMQQPGATRVTNNVTVMPSIA